MTEQLISDYAELSEEEGTANPERSVAIWKLVVLFMCISVVMLSVSIVLCVVDDTCRAALPTFHTLINNPITSPYVIIAGVGLIAVHCVIALGIYYRVQLKSRALGVLQMGFSIILYISLAIALFIFPATGWNRDWGNLATLVVMFVWMLIAQLALRRVYVDRIYAERKWLRLNVVLIVLYGLSSVAYIVVRAVPQTQYLTTQMREIGLLVTECVFGLTIVVFMIMTLVHTKNVRYMCFYRK